MLQRGGYPAKQDKLQDMTFESEDPLEGLRKPPAPSGGPLGGLCEKPAPPGGWESDEEWPQQTPKRPGPPTYPSNPGNLKRDQFTSEDNKVAYPAGTDLGESSQESSQTSSTSYQESYNNIPLPEGASKWDRFANTESEGIGGGAYYHSRFSPQDRQCYTNIDPQEFQESKMNHGLNFGYPVPGMINQGAIPSNVDCQAQELSRMQQGTVPHMDYSKSRARNQGAMPSNEIGVPSGERYTEKVASYLQGLQEKSFPELEVENNKNDDWADCLNIQNERVHAKREEDSLDWDDSFDNIVAGQFLTPDVEQNLQNHVENESTINQADGKHGVFMEGQLRDSEEIVAEQSSSREVVLAIDDNVNKPSQGNSQDSEDRTGLTPRIDSHTGLTPDIDSPGIKQVSSTGSKPCTGSPLIKPLGQSEITTVSPQTGSPVTAGACGFRPIQRKFSPNPGGLQAAMASECMDHVSSPLCVEQREPVRKILKPTAKRGVYRINHISQFHKQIWLHQLFSMFRFSMQLDFTAFSKKERKEKCLFQSTTMIKMTTRLSQ